MLKLAGGTIAALVTPPYSWRGEFVEQAWTLAKRASIPAGVSAFGFGYGAPGVQGTLIAELLGDPTRVAAIVGPATVREQAVWITGMVVAGVAGTAICADLGARKVRQELAALEVMGVDPVRKLVAPRVLAHRAADAGAGHHRDHHRGDRDHARQPAVHRHGRRLLRGDVTQLHDDRPRRQPGQDHVSGAVVGLVCCYKGMNAKGGPQGVGRAVNQAVVISFCVIWVLNFAFNSTYLGAFPGAQAVR